MPLLLLAVPALVAAPPAPPALGPVDRAQDLLMAVPAAFLDGKSSALPGLVTKAATGWEQARPDFLKALGGDETAAVDRQIKAMAKMGPREQAAGALGLSTVLSRVQGRSRRQDELNARRTAMQAWCLVDAGQLEPLPSVAAAFKPLVDEDQGRHTLAVLAVQEALGRLHDGQQKKQASGVKKALKDLVRLAEAFAKP